MSSALPIVPPQTLPARPVAGLATMLTAGRASESEQRLAGGTTLFEAGDTARCLYEVVEGVLKLSSTTPDGASLILDFLVPGDVVGMEMSSIHPHTAQAIGPTIVRPIPRSQMLLAMLEDDEAADMFRKLARRRDLASKRHRSWLGLRHDSQRMAGFLACIAERLWADGRNSGTIALPMPRRDIARYLAMPPETFCRSLRRLADRRLIRPHLRGLVDIPSLPGLVEYMSGH